MPFPYTYSDGGFEIEARGHQIVIVILDRENSIACHIKPRCQRSNRGLEVGLIYRSAKLSSCL